MHEPHLLQETVHQEVLGRLEHLSPMSEAQWGKMNVAQMMAHVTANLEMAMSHERVKQAFVGRIFGSVAKRQILTKGMMKNIGTLASLKIADQRGFETEQEALHDVLERFYQGGEAGMTKQPHEFFGCLTPNEWARLQYLHIDHHLSQFGV